MTLTLSPGIPSSVSGEPGAQVQVSNPGPFALRVESRSSALANQTTTVAPGGSVLLRPYDGRLSLSSDGPVTADVSPTSVSTRSRVSVATAALTVAGGADWTGADPDVDHARVVILTNNGSSDLLVEVTTDRSATPTAAACTDTLAGGERQGFYVEEGEVVRVVRPAGSTAANVTAKVVRA